MRVIFIAALLALSACAHQPCPRHDNIHFKDRPPKFTQMGTEFVTLSGIPEIDDLPLRAGMFATGTRRE